MSPFPISHKKINGTFSFIKVLYFYVLLSIIIIMARARAYLCSGSWEGSSYTRLPHLASPPFAALLTTVLKHCSPLHTTVLKH